MDRKPFGAEELKRRAQEAAALLKVLSHRNRILIACQLMGGEQSVSEIEAGTGVTQPLLSRELARLRQSELVMTRRQSKQVFYRLADDRLERVIRALCDAFGPPPGDSLASSKVKVRKPGKKSARRALPRSRPSR